VSRKQLGTLTYNRIPKMTKFYVAQELILASESAGDWPEVIPKPDSEHGRLKMIDGVQDMIDGITQMKKFEHAGGDGWWDGFRQAVSGRDKVVADFD